MNHLKPIIFVFFYHHVLVPINTSLLPQLLCLTIVLRIFFETYLLTGGPFTRPPRHHNVKPKPGCIQLFHKHFPKSSTNEKQTKPGGLAVFAAGWEHLNELETIRHSLPT
jgi:hypothetical protein